MTKSEVDASKEKTAIKDENPWINLLVNLVIPTVILTKFSGPENLGPINGLILAVLFPLVYGVFDLLKRRRINAISLLGLISTVLTGGLGLFQVGGIWFAIKEASIPMVAALALIGSMFTKSPLVNVMLINDKVMRLDDIDAALRARGNQEAFKDLVRESTFLLAFSFIVSAVLNFVLAIVILKSPPGTPAFNEELGRMTALSFPVIMGSSSVVLIFALWRLFSRLKKLTGLEFEAIFRN